ncbi:MAG: CheR family methyltransferase [Nitrospirota bacterium]
MKDAEGVHFLQWCLPKLGLIWPGYRKVQRQGFDHTAEGSLIKAEFREPVTFVEQDIRHTMPRESFHLILCRYLVFTYFDAPLQGKTLQHVQERMRVGGALVIGRDERLPGGELGLIPWSQKAGVYRRASPAIVAT